MLPKRARLLLPLAAAGCLWVPLGGDAAPAVALEEVRRSSGSQPERIEQPERQVGGRGSFFEDSLIAFRTQVNAAGVRFRVWNKRSGLIRIEWDTETVGEPRGACPAAATQWELRRSGGAAPADVLGPGASVEKHAVAVARVPTPEGGLWRSVPLACIATDPSAPRAALRLAVETEAGRHLYTFRYGAGTRTATDPGTLLSEAEP